jgi:transposase-like protein
MTKIFVADARRRWSEEEKQVIIEESKTNPVARVAKKHGVATSLLFRWRKMQGIGARKPRRKRCSDPTLPIILASDHDAC